VDILVRIAALWLLEEDYARAEERIHKAANMIKDKEVREDPLLNLKYKSCFAQISDWRRKFLDAASKVRCLFFFFFFLLKLIAPVLRSVASDQ
jgi:hypothetical protein